MNRKWRGAWKPRLARMRALILLDCAAVESVAEGNLVEMPDYSRLAASALFVTSGTLHFARPQMFRAIVPPGLPNPAALVAISGAAEIAGAIGLWLPRTRRAAAFGLVVLLFAVFPANVYMAVERERFAAVAPGWLLLARLPVQAVLVVWIWVLRNSGN